MDAGSSVVVQLTASDRDRSDGGFEEHAVLAVGVEHAVLDQHVLGLKIHPDAAALGVAAGVDASQRRVRRGEQEPAVAELAVDRRCPGAVAADAGVLDQRVVDEPEMQSDFVDVLVEIAVPDRHVIIEIHRRPGPVGPNHGDVIDQQIVAAVGPVTAITLVIRVGFQMDGAERVDAVKVERRNQVLEREVS